MLLSFTQAMTDKTHVVLRSLRKNLRARYKDASPLYFTFSLFVWISQQDQMDFLTD